MWLRMLLPGGFVGCRDTFSTVFWMRQTVLGTAVQSLRSSLIVFLRDAFVFARSCTSDQLCRVQKTTGWTSRFRWRKTRIEKTASWTYERTSEGNTPIHPIQRTRNEETNNSKDLKKIIIRSILAQDGGLILVTGKLAKSNIFVFITSMGTAPRLEIEQKLEFLAIFILDWTEVIFFRSEMLFFFCACRNFNSLAIDGGCGQIHLLHAMFGRVQLFTHCLHSFTHTRYMRGSRGPRLKFDLRPQNRSFIHASCFTLRLTVHKNQHKTFLSLTSLLCYCRPLLRTQTCCPRIHLSTMNNKTIPDVDDGFGIFNLACREHTLLEQTKIQSARSDFRRKSDWTSHRSSHRATSWQPWTWNLTSE